MQAFLDSDEGVMLLHASEGDEENEAHALLAMLYVFLASHAVVIFDSFFDPEWIRRLRLLSELRRNVHGSKGPPTPLVFCLEDESVRFNEIAAVFSEYRNMNDSNKRLFRLQDADTSSMSTLSDWLSPLVSGRKVNLPTKIPSKKDLLELAKVGERNQLFFVFVVVVVVETKNGVKKVLLSSSSSSSLVSKPLARRVVAACNCGQRQVVLRDVADSSAAPCCIECAVPLSASGSSQWNLSVLPVGTGAGPGFVDSSGTALLSFRNVSFGIEYECPSGHRFFLTDAMARVVLRLTQLDKLIGTDVPLYTKCLACKQQQEATDAGPAQLMRLHVAAAVPGNLLVDPVLKFKLKNGPGPSFSFRLPCRPISICGTSYYVLKLPRVYSAPDNSGWIVQRDINSPYVAVLNAGWLKNE